MPEAPKRSRGVGDTVANFTAKTRLDRLSGSSCGCARRQAALNRRFPYNRRLQKVVPDERPITPSSPIYRTKRRHGWTKERIIDGKTFRRFKMYGNSPSDLAMARSDAQTLRDNEGYHARVLLFSTGYHLFTWKPPRPSRRKYSPRNYPVTADTNPKSGLVDGVLTKFNRRKNDA